MLFILTNQKLVYAQNAPDPDFDISANITYTVSEDETTRVNQKITIVNKKEFVYSPSYSITLQIKNISSIQATNDDGNIPYTVKDTKTGGKTIDLTFPKRIVGAGKVNQFNLSFTTSDFAQKTGSVWRVIIPSLSDPEDFSSYIVHISTPTSFGIPNIIKPNIPYSTQGSTYTFTKEALRSGGVVMLFGSSQVYKFNLTYHIENKNLFPVKTEIALPPNTSYQEVLISDITLSAHLLSSHLQA